MLYLTVLLSTNANAATHLLAAKATVPLQLTRYRLFVLFDMQFTFGYGVGGEYPMAAGSAAERAEAKGRASARKRGREVACLPPTTSSVFNPLQSCACVTTYADTATATMR